MNRKTRAWFKMADTSKIKKQTYNMTFCILSGLAIIMVAAGHLGYDLLSVDGLFPYYSFHVPLFMFISGYFYKDAEEERPLTYVKKKCSRLLVPYLIWNLFYGSIALLLRNCGLAMGESMNFRTLFLAPFLHGHQFIYNYAAWFVPALFVIEMMNLLMRLIARRLFRMSPEKLEWLYLTASLLVGMAVVHLAIGGHIWGNYKAPGRILFLYPCFQMGQFYRKYLEEHDTLGNLPYFTILIGIQTLLHLCCNGLAFSSVWCTGFANGPVIPYVTIVSGIAFWLRIARLLTPVTGENRAVQYLGRNTFTVMMHHVMIFMLIKMILAGIAAHTGLCADFDFEQYRTNIDYIYLVKGTEHFKMVYLAAGIAIPLLLRYAVERLWKKRHWPVARGNK